MSCSVIRTARQIDTKLMHPCETFCENLLVKVYFLHDLNFLTHGLKQKSFSLGFVVMRNIVNLKPCHVVLKQPAEIDGTAKRSGWSTLGLLL